MNLDRFLPHFERRQQNRYDELKEPHLLTKISEMGMSSHGYKDIWINVDFWGFLSEIETQFLQHKLYAQRRIENGI